MRESIGRNTLGADVREGEPMNENPELVIEWEGPCQLVDFFEPDTRKKYDCPGVYLWTEGDLPSGWLSDRRFGVEVDEVSVFAKKRWWEQSTRELDRGGVSSFIERPPEKPKSYRR